MTTPLHVDVNVFLPDELRTQSQLRAIQINPANRPAPPEPGAPPADLRLALAKARLWPNGHTLPIRFVWHNSPYATQPAAQQTIQDRIIHTANQWLTYANLQFDFGDHAAASIRISFNPSQGSYSYIGTDNTLIPPEKATMNFGWLTPTSSDETYARVVLHEFGHAIGCIHEHARPIAPIRWNKPVVDAYYAALGWDQQQIDTNVYATFAEASTNHSTQFDPDSIMTYPIPPEHTLDGYTIPWRNQLSAIDKSHIAQVYPKG